MDKENTYMQKKMKIDKNENHQKLSAIETLRKKHHKLITTITLIVDSQKIIKNS